MTEQETAVNRNGWTMNTLYLHMQTEFASLRAYHEAQTTDLRRLLDERYATQTNSLDKAFNAASLGVTTALQSAREASAKAEENAEKRFESFRMESTMQIRGVAEKQVEEADRVSARIGELTTRLDLSQGQGTGADKQKTALLAVGGFIIAATALITRLLFP